MSPKERSSDKDPDRTGAIAADEIEAEAEAAGQPDAMRAQIEETRAELGDTVEALSAKADVKGQVKDKVDERKAQLRGQQARAQAKLGELSGQAKGNPTPLAAGAGGAVALLLVVRRLRRRR